ncbi:MAG: HD domain-containing protein [Thermomicrobiales bacterium]
MPESHSTNRNESAIDPVSRSATPESGLLALARWVSSLKTVPRTGWLDRGIDPVATESVADHSFGVALLAWAAALERAAAGEIIDPGRVLMLALIHDLAEAATGDVTPYDLANTAIADDPESRRAFFNRAHHRYAGNRAARHAAEDAAIAVLLETSPAAFASTVRHLWSELRAAQTAEARFVKQVDRLETFLQSRYYLESDPRLPVESFRHEVMETIDDALLTSVRDRALTDAGPTSAMSAENPE